MSAPRSPTHSRPAASPSAAGNVFPAGVRSLFSRRFAPMFIGLGLAVVGASLAPRISPSARLSNLDLTRTGFSDSYLLFERSAPERAYLLNRRDATVRRSDLGLSGQPWSSARFGRPESGDHWLLGSAAGHVLLLPLEAIDDWAYPFLFAFVAETHPDLGLPDIAWTQLFVNRSYRGLYLRVDWAARDNRRRPGAGDEFLLLADEGAASVSTGLESGTLYERLLAAGVVPQLEPPDAVLVWLASHQPTDERMLHLPDEEPFALRLMPLPFSLSEVVALRSGAELEPQADLAVPAGALTLADARETVPVAEERLDQMRDHFNDYRRDFQAALAAHQRVFGRPASESATPRDGSTAELGLNLGEP